MLPQNDCSKKVSCSVPVYAMHESSLSMVGNNNQGQRYNNGNNNTGPCPKKGMNVYLISGKKLLRQKQ